MEHNRARHDLSCLTPRSPTGSARARRTRHPRADRRPAAYRPHPARLWPPSRRDRDAPLRQHRLQRDRVLLRHQPAVCDPCPPATRPPACRRAGARIARTGGTGPRYRLPRTARQARASRAADPSPAPADASRQQPAGTTGRGARRAETRARRPARPAGTIPNCSCRHWRNSRRRCAAVRSAARWSRSASTWRWCPASAPARSGTTLFDSIRLHGGSVATLMLEKTRRRGGVLQGAGQDAREQLGLAGDGTRGTPPRAGVLHRRGGGSAVRSGLGMEGDGRGGGHRAALERFFYREWKTRPTLSLRGAQRRSNPLPDERNAARQAGDCFGAARLRAFTP